MSTPTLRDIARAAAMEAVLKAGCTCTSCSVPHVADAMVALARDFARRALAQVDFSVGYGEIGRGSRMPDNEIDAAIAAAEAGK